MITYPCQKQEYWISYLINNKQLSSHPILFNDVVELCHTFVVSSFQYNHVSAHYVDSSRRQEYIVFTAVKITDLSTGYSFSYNSFAYISCILYFGEGSSLLTPIAGSTCSCFYSNAWKEDLITENTQMVN